MQSDSDGQPWLQVAMFFVVRPPGRVPVCAATRELAAIAAEWFQYHWDEWLPQRDRFEEQGL